MDRLGKQDDHARHPRGDHPQFQGVRGETGVHRLLGGYHGVYLSPSKQSACSTASVSPMRA